MSWNYCWWFDFPINFGTVIIASIAIGAGIDFTIHFIERFKTEHIEKKLDFEEAYFNTLKENGGNQPDVKFYDSYDFLLQMGVQAEVLIDQDL